MRCKSYAVLAFLLVISLAVTGCGRFEVSDNAQVSEEQADIATPVPNAETPEPVDEPGAAGELIPFAESRGLQLLYGYMDQDGNVVIEPRFGSAEPFYACGLAVVKDTNGKSGLIDRTGKFLVKPEADSISYSDGVFIVLIYGEDTAARAYDENGTLLFEKDYIYPFSEGLSRWYSDGTRGYIDKTGKLVLEVPYKNIDNFYDGIAMVSMEYDGPSFFIDKQGNDLTDTISSGLRMFKDEASGLFGYMDKDGNRVIEPQYYNATPFRDGLAIVCVEGSNGLVYGIIDTQGNYVLAPEYCGIKRMRNGSFAVGEKIPEDVFVPSMYADYSRKALFSRDLKKHTEWIYLELDNFDADYTCASDGTKVIYLDDQLNPASDLPQFEGRGLMLAEGSLLRGTINGQVTVADRQGNILVRDEKLTLLGNGVTARSVTRYPHDYTTVMYPVLEGLGDVWIEDQLNRFIREQAESYVSFDGTYAEEDHYFFPITDINCSVNIIKNLVHIELSVDEYWIGAAHPGYDWGNEYVSLIDGKRYVIDDLFKSPDEARQRLCEKVNGQIEELAEDAPDFFDQVKPEQIRCFHLEDDGITIYFPVYEIAPYAAGMPMFHIPYSEIMDLIDTEGDFWKAFN